MNRKMKFRTKLCLYFLLFTLIIFGVLWLLQTVFLQKFYNNMLINHTKSAVGEMESAGISDGNFEIIDNIARENSLLVYITDKKGNIIYSADEYKSNNFDNENPYLKGEKLNYQESIYRNLPENYTDFLKALENGNGVTEYQTETHYIYGKYLKNETVLYISTTLDAVGSTANIIKIQLLWVSVLSVITAVIIARFISGKFAKPIFILSEQANKLGSKSFSGEFEKGFCMEIDELENVLADTNEKLVQAKTYQQELLANVSHDLRTPLTMIRGYAESIKDFGDDEKQRISDSDIIIRETDRLTALVNEILEYSELQGNGERTNFAEVNFSSLVKKVIKQFEPLFQMQGGMIESILTENLFINGNSRQLERVIYNLLDNAIRHTGESKKITVILKKENENILLSVRDYGDGIPQEEIPHIWERYYTYRQRNKQGVSGLGLAIVKQIVDLHGGFCKVESKIGEGSLFELIFLQNTE